MKGVFKSIDGRDKTITPFKVYKSWEFSSSSSLDSYGIHRMVAIKPNIKVFSGNLVTLDSAQVNSDTGSYLINISNDKASSVIWYSLNHLYYKRAGIPYDTFGNTDHQQIQRNLYQDALVFSIPQLCMGEGLRPGSVSLNLTPSGSRLPINLIDDGKGNLIDTALSSSISNEVFYLRLNESTYESNWESMPSSYSSSVQTFSINSLNKDLIVSGKNVTISNKNNSASISGSWGNSVYFSDNGYIRIPNNDLMNFKQDDDFTISFWYSNTCIDSNIDYILTKRTTGFGNTKSKGIINAGNVNMNKSQYPFEISYIPSETAGIGTLSCKQSTGTVVTELTSTYLADGTRNHISLIKTGSLFQLYINGILTSTSTLPTGNIQNQSDIFIGSLGLNSQDDGFNGINGSVDEFFIFNKGLSESEVIQLADTSSLNLMSTNTNIVGNVFYEHGIVIVSDPRPKYNNISDIIFNDVLYNVNDVSKTVGTSKLNSFYLNFSSTVTLYEHEYVCRLNEDEFNFTTNSTIRNNDEHNSQIPKEFVSNQEWAPYITTVGLYNDKFELVAIAKLANAVKKRDNVDLNIIVRFDL